MLFFAVFFRLKHSVSYVRKITYGPGENISQQCIEYPIGTGMGG